MAVRRTARDAVKPLFWKLVRSSPVDLYLRRSRARASAKRLASARELATFEQKLMSQNGEDGILREIFSRIAGDRFFVEFGVEDGSECNCALPAQRYGWRGVFIEADAGKFAELESRYSPFPGVRCVRAKVGRGNIAEIFREQEVPIDFDLLSIDIDGNDYWVWEALAAYRPKAVVIEYNATLGPERRSTIAYDDDHVWIHDWYFGASLAALERLGRRLGYALIGAESAGVNAFFIRRDLLDACGFPELTPREAYRPNRAVSLFLPRSRKTFVDV